jgi:hypothetical protein
MSFQDWFTELREDRDARTRRERHGRGELTLVDGVPQYATGCLLPDGALTDAECLLAHVAVPDTTCRVWTRRLPASILRRRGRLVVENGVGLFFADEPDADLISNQAELTAVKASLECDLGLSVRLRGLVRCDLFATLLYGALCNTVWRHKATGVAWSCGWRHAGSVVANLRSEGDYTDWYCSGGEGLVDEQVLVEFTALGWELAELPRLL